MWHAGVVSRESELTVAVTGPTGTFGFGLIPLLQAEDRVARIVGIARRPFDPAAYGWTKLEYRRGDVRDEAALLDAFAVSPPWKPCGTPCDRGRPAAETPLASAQAGYDAQSLRAGVAQ